MELALEVKFSSTFTELHVHGDERWPMEVTSITYFRWSTEVTSIRISADQRKWRQYVFPLINGSDVKHIRISAVSFNPTLHFISAKLNFSGAILTDPKLKLAFRGLR